jgi:GLPGLI family protein
MKRAILSLAAGVCAVALAAFTPAPGGKAFEGVVNYEVDMKSSSLPPEALAMMQGSQMKMYTNGEKSRIEMNFGITSNTTIVDNKAKTSVVLMDMMGQKYMLKGSTEEPKDAVKPEIKYVDGTKEIAGYKCKKAEMTVTDKDGTKNTFEVYYTEDIPYDGKFKNGISGLKGFPMEYTMRAPEYDMTMHFTVKSLSKEKVSEDMFKIPEGYKETTREEMMKSMGGQ